MPSTSETKLSTGASARAGEPILIVAGRSSVRGAERPFLPFEGDELLAIILSKAFLLAEDDKIEDPMIRSQLGR